MRPPTSPPTLHVRPARGWLNDPNAVIRHGGLWHVFFQHNPLLAQHAAIHWGHVTSPDLVRWTERPVAFGPTPDGPDRGGCWSGSHLDGLDRPAVVYTGIADSASDSTVCLRYADDEALAHWSPPRVVAREPRDVGIREMRDPYPFVWRGRRYAVLGAGLEDGTPAVLLFSLDDPHAWRYEGLLLTGGDDVAAAVAPAEVWECPQLVRLADGGQGVALVLSLWVAGRLTDVVYLLGDLHGEAGTAPRFVPRSGQRLDHGPDFYAPQVVEDETGAPLLFGWVRQADAPDEAPADAVAGCLTLPRRLHLRQDRVHVEPHPAVHALVGGALALPARQAREGQVLHLPIRVRVRVGRRAGAALPRVHLVAGASRVRLDLTGAGPEIWLDGEVAEVYDASGTPSTVREPGATSWALTGDLDGCVTTCHELRLPD